MNLSFWFWHSAYLLSQSLLLFGFFTPTTKSMAPAFRKFTSHTMLPPLSTNPVPIYLFLDFSWISHLCTGKHGTGWFLLRDRGTVREEFGWQNQKVTWMISWITIFISIYQHLPTHKFDASQLQDLKLLKFADDKNN